MTEKEMTVLEKEKQIDDASNDRDDLELDEKKKEKFDWRNMEPWQKRRLWGSLLAIIVVFGLFLGFTCNELYQDRKAENTYWNNYMEENSELQAVVAERSVSATEVQTAVYLEQVRSVDVKNSQFEVVLNVGFRWEGDPTIDFSTNETIHFYKGSIKTNALMEDYHEGMTNYQCIRYDVVINKQFWTKRFPLESHQLRVYMEPSNNVTRIVLVPAKDQCYVNESLGISGYKLTRFDTAQTIISYDEPLLNPVYDAYTDEDEVYKTEIMTQLEINRDGWGLYLKCFIAMYGTTAWIILCLYLCTFRRVDPLGMIGSSFFGAVSNVMVGASLVPDALDVGLLEYGNLFGVAVIIAGSTVVISINAIRKERNNNVFAHFYGRIMMAVFIVVAVVGNIALPMSAFMG